MSVYYWPPTTIERQQANAKERAASNWENGGRQLARCNAPAQMQMRARLRHQLQAMEDPDSWDAISLKEILSMPEWKASVLAAEAETDAVQRGKGGGAKAAVMLRRFVTETGLRRVVPTVSCRDFVGQNDRTEAR